MAGNNAATSQEEKMAIDHQENHHLGLIQDEDIERFSISSGSNEVTHIMEYPSLELTGTSALLYYCEKRLLKPYFQILALLGWRQLWPDAGEPGCIKRTLSALYFLFVLALLVSGYILQYLSCYRETRGMLPPFKSMVKNSTTNITQSLQSQVDERECAPEVLLIYLIPSCLLLAAYFHFCYLMRYSENEQLHTLMERTFLQTSASTLTHQKSMLRRLRLLMSVGALWLGSSCVLEIIHSMNVPMHFHFVPPSLVVLPKGVLVLSLCCRDFVQIVLITNYCIQCQLLILCLSSVAMQLLEHSVSIQTCISQIQYTEKFLRYLNQELSIGIGSLLLMNISRFTADTVWLNAALKASLIPTSIASLSALRLSLILLLISFPVLQAVRLSSAYSQLHSLALLMRSRPFGYQDTPLLELDSYLLYSGSAKKSYRAELLCMPMTAHSICFLFFLLLVLGATSIQLAF